ncbi:MAG: hypothetical protein ABWZ80_00265 [Beijerinckiaceae bacterium]
MNIGRRDIGFIVANAIIGGALGFAVGSDALSEDGAFPPLMLIFIGMALIELAAGYVFRIPLGEFVSMPIRLAALVAAFCVYMLAKL